MIDRFKVGDIVKEDMFGPRMVITRFYGEQPREAVCKLVDEWDEPVGDEIMCFTFALTLILRHYVEKAGSS